MRRFVSAAAMGVLAIAAGTASGATDVAKIPGTIGELPMLVIPAGEAMKELSADLDGAAWKTAATVKVGEHGGTKANEALGTWAKVFCTQENLYVGYRCGESDMEHLTTKALDIWGRDEVELFVEPQESLVKKPYHHVIVDTAGGKMFERVHVYPRYFQLRAYEETWQPKAEVLVKRGSGEWVCVMSIPLADLHVGAEASNGGMWRMNLCRNRPGRGGAAPAEMTWSWSSLGNLSFQSPWRFGYAVPAMYAKGELAGYVAKLDAAAPRDASGALAADPATGTRVDALIEEYWKKPEALKELEKIANQGDAIHEKVEEAVKRTGRRAARELAYLLERDRPEMDPPADSVLAKVARFEPMQQSNATGTLGYLLYKPDGADKGGKFPLMIFMHGSAECGSDNGRQLYGGAVEYGKDGVQAKYPCFVMAPQCPLGSGWADMKSNPESRPALQATTNYRLADKPGDTTVLLLEAIDAVLAKNPAIDRDRIYVGGQSLGGFGTWELLMRRTTFFAAAVVLCGGGDETKAALVKDVPIWDFHGVLDDRVKVQASRMMKASMEKVGGKAKFTEFPDRGHSLGTPNVGAETLEWMFGQKKK